MKDLKLAVEQWAIGKLVPYARNARTHSPDQVSQIAASIREFGFVNPVGVDAKGTLIWGHGRVLAAKQLDMQTVPVIRLGHLTEAQAAALRIADNAIAINSGWDLDALRAELGELHAADFDLSLLGFSADQLHEFTADAPSGADPEAVPEPPKNPVSKTGDLWLMGASVKCPKCGKTTPLEDAVKGVKQ
jgi:hypothetical protein